MMYKIQHLQIIKVIGKKIIASGKVFKKIWKKIIITKSQKILTKVIALGKTTKKSTTTKNDNRNLEQKDNILQQ